MMPVIVIAFPLMGVLLAVLAAIMAAARRDGARPADAIVVLGAEQRGGVPTPVFRARLDHAAALLAKGIAPVVVVTGGVGAGERESEAKVARRYLAGRGVHDASIVAEHEGVSTWTSLIAAARLMRRRGIRRIVVVSDGFHLFRACLMAARLGFDCTGSPASASPIRPGSLVEFRYILREVGALVAWAAGSTRPRALLPPLGKTEPELAPVRKPR